jgi:hypothetical protein
LRDFSPLPSSPPSKPFSRWYPEWLLTFFFLRQCPAVLPRLVLNSWTLAVLLSSWVYRNVPPCPATVIFQNRCDRAILLLKTLAVLQVPG